MHSLINVLKPRRYRFWYLTAPLTICALSLAERSGAAEGAPAKVPAGWTAEIAHDLSIRVSLYTEPGDEDAASKFGEVVFEFPDELVDLEKTTEALLDGFDMEVTQSLPIEPRLSVYQKAFMAHESGDSQVYRIDVLALREPGRQRVLLMAALPDKHAALGGRNALIETFTDAKSIEALTAAAAERHGLLYGLPDEHVVTTSSGGVALTLADFRVVVDTVEYMSGRTLSPDHIQTLFDAAEAEWEDDPDLAGIAAVRDFLLKAEAADPAKRRDAAVSLYVEALKNARQTGEASQALDLVKALNPVLAEENGVILTERAVEARLRSVKAVMQIQGAKVDQIDNSIPRVRREIIESFSDLPDDRRSALQFAESRWLKLLGSMINRAPEDRRHSLAEAAKFALGDTSPSNVAHHLEQRAVNTNNYNDWIEAMIYADIVVPSFHFN